MQKRHLDRQKYFDEQEQTTHKYVIPYIQKWMPIQEETRVLEIGCGEGGNLKPFLDIGCQCVGIDLACGQIEKAQAFFADHPQSSRLTLLCRDIYLTSAQEIGQFDIIMMRDVIEHIHDQQKFMGFVKAFLRPGAKFFLGFPPWYNPFGGHQQISKSKVISKTPYIHLLPGTVYKNLLQWLGEEPARIDTLMEIKETGISIERFRKIAKAEGYKTLQETLYLINPNYEVKFGLQPKAQFAFLAAVPHVRNYFTTCCYCLLEVQI